VALRSGLVLRHYVVEEVIGAGGFGITYRARHATLKTKVFALKEYFPREFAARNGTQVISTAQGAATFRWGLDRFLKEAEALARCQHRAIVDVVDYFEANGTAYAVLGYVEGEQLGHWLTALGRPPSQAELDRLLMPLLDALEVVHGAGLLHRDIAPDNILVRPDGTPCLIDFGAAREDVRDRSRKVSAIVKHGYSPPEQYHGLAELQGPWTDIYAVGATLYRAVAGTPPMDSSRRGALGDGLQPVAEMTEVAYRPGFMAAVDKALALKPEDRPSSVAEWRHMLMDETAPTEVAAPKDAAKPGAPGSRPAPDPEPRPTPRPEPLPPDPGPRRLLPVVLAAAALAIGGIGAWAVLAPREPTGPGAVVVRPEPAPREAPRPDPEQIAQAAWQRVAGSSDVAEIERFIAEHGGAAVAGQARERLATLRREAADREAAQRLERERQQRERAAADAWAAVPADADRAAIERFLAAHGTSSLAETARARLAALGLAEDRARERDAEWRACREATDATRRTACAPVLAGDQPSPRRAAAHMLVGVALRKAGQYDAAIAELGRALQLVPGRTDPIADSAGTGQIVPGRAVVLNERGTAHFLKGDRAAAIADFTEAFAVDPRHAEALNNRAWTRLQDGNATAALADADRSIALDPGKAYAYDTRGHIYEALGRRDDAIRDYERALQIDGTQEASRAALARLRAQR
jgi:tetratricopeptide (TPR) repeat protein